MANATRFLLLSAALCVSACATPRFLIEAEAARTNTHIVLAFEETVFNRHRVKEGFHRYVATDYREHDAEMRTRFEGGTPASAPLRLIVKHTVAQKDLVAVDALWGRDDEPGGELSRVDIYRLVDAKIVEHWSVQQPYRDAQGDGDAQP